MLYRHEGLVQTQALYSMEAPWLPKSDNGTRSPSLHLRHRGNAFSTKSPPSFSRGIVFACLSRCFRPGLARSKPRGSLRRASASPQTVIRRLCRCYDTILSFMCQQAHEVFFMMQQTASNVSMRFLSSPANDCSIPSIAGSPIPVKLSWTSMYDFPSRGVEISPEPGNIFISGDRSRTHFPFRSSRSCRLWNTEGKFSAERRTWLLKWVEAER